MQTEKRSNPTRLTLPSDREIAIIREFRAPRDLVFDTWSKPEHIEQWTTCPILTMPVCEMDFRVGGRWRHVLRERESGREHAMSGEYREIVRPDKLVFTERYEPIPGSDHLVTVTFTEHDGITTLTQLFEHPSKEGRDAHLRSGMENGIQDASDRMERVMASIRERQ